MSVKKTQLNGIVKMIESWLPIIQDMDGYFEEDYNPYYDLWAALSEAQDLVYYCLKDTNE